MRFATASSSDFFGASSDGLPITEVRIVSQFGSSRQIWVDNVAISQIPEPSGASLLALATVVLIRRRR